MSTQARGGSAQEAKNEPMRPSALTEVRAWMGVGAVLLINLVSGVWWAATLSARLDHMGQSLAELKNQAADRYTGKDARRDFSAIEMRMADHEARLRVMEKR